MQVRFDDIGALRALQSERFGPYGRPLLVTQAMINAFAALTGDAQWIHTDVARARAESPYGAPIAHGFLVLSLLPALADGSNLEIVGMSSVINYGADRLRFVGAVPAESRVYCRRRITEVSVRDKGTQIATEREVAVVGEARPAMIYRALTLYMS